MSDKPDRALTTASVEAPLTAGSSKPPVERVVPKKNFGNRVAARIGLAIVIVYIFVFTALAVLSTVAFVMSWQQPATTWHRLGEATLVLLYYAIAGFGIAAQVTIARFAFALARPLSDLAPQFQQIRRLQRRFTRCIVPLLIFQALFLLLLFALGSGLGGLQARALFWPELLPINVVHDPYTFYVSGYLSYLIAVLSLVPGVSAYGFNLLVFDFLFWILLSEWLDTRVRTLGATLTIAELYHPNTQEAQRFGLRGEQHGAFTAQDLPGEVHFQVALDVHYDAEKYPHSVVRPDSWVALGGRDSRKFIIEELANPAFVEDLRFFLKVDGPALEQVLDNALAYDCHSQLEIARERAAGINKTFDSLFARVKPNDALLSAADSKIDTPIATGLRLRGQQFVLPANSTPGAGLTIADKQDFLAFMLDTKRTDKQHLEHILHQNLQLSDTDIQRLRERVVCLDHADNSTDQSPDNTCEAGIARPFSRGFPYQIRMSAWTPAGISTYTVNFDC